MGLFTIPLLPLIAYFGKSKQIDIEKQYRKQQEMNSPIDAATENLHHWHTILEEKETKLLSSTEIDTVALQEYKDAKYIVEIAKKRLDNLVGFRDLIIKLCK